MIQKISQALFPPAMKDYTTDFSRENYRVLGKLIYGGVFLCLFFTFFAFTLSSGMHLKVLSVQYLIFFTASSCVRFNLNNKFSDRGTLLIYIWFGILFTYLLGLYTINASDQSPFLILFLLLLPALLIRDAWGRILFFTIIFSAAFCIIELLTRSGDMIITDLFRLAVTLFIVLSLSHRTNGERVKYMVSTDTATKKADHDALTGIFNRRGGEELITSYLRDENPGAFLIIDVDNFKHINDTYGHAAGDTVLQKVAETIQGSFRETDVVMRMGGDEFIVYALGLADMQHVETKLESLRSSLHEIILDKKTDDHVTASMGCIVNLGSYTSYESLYLAADELLYLVKTVGKDNFRCSDKERK